MSKQKPFPVWHLRTKPHLHLTPSSSRPGWLKSSWGASSVVRMAQRTHPRPPGCHLFHTFQGSIFRTARTALAKVTEQSWRRAKQWCRPALAYRSRYGARLLAKDMHLQTFSCTLPVKWYTSTTKSSTPFYYFINSTLLSCPYTPTS